MSLKNAHVLVIDDDVDVLTAVRLLLKPEVKEVITEKNPENIRSLLARQNFDVIMLDMNYTAGATNSKEGFEWLSRILEIDPGAVVIMITAYGDIELAVRALKEGATDFVLKPWQNEKLIATLSAAAKLKKSYQEVESL